MCKLVSVIIPTYKGVMGLERAINSVLGQTYSNIEIIVVDDNGFGTSAQIETQKIIEKFGGKIKYIVHEQNKNGAAARNSGLRHCLGHYVCFLDDDDVMLPRRISCCVKKLENNLKYDAVFVNVLCTDEKLVPTRVIEIEKDGNCYKDVLLNSMFFGSGSNLFLRKHAIDKIGFFDEKFLRHQDLEYMLRFYQLFLSTHISEILLIKAKNGTNNIPEYAS